MLIINILTLSCARLLSTCLYKNVAKYSIGSFGRRSTISAKPRVKIGPIENRNHCKDYIRKLMDFNIPTFSFKYKASIELGSGGGRRPEFVRFMLKV